MVYSLYSFEMACSVTDFERFFNFRYNNGCIAYPEGRILKESRKSQLRTGVMEVAYNLNCPCQIIIKRGTENIINQDNFELLENVPVTVCVSEVLIPHDYKSKEEWFNKVGDVWDKTNESLEKCKIGKEIIAPLPGVNTDLCIDEKISENAIVYSVSVIIGLVALCYALYHM